MSARPVFHAGWLIYGAMLPIVSARTPSSAGDLIAPALWWIDGFDSRFVEIRCSRAHQLVRVHGFADRVSGLSRGLDGDIAPVGIRRGESAVAVRQELKRGNDAAKRKRRESLRVSLHPFMCLASGSVLFLRLRFSNGGRAKDSETLAPD